MVNMSNISDFIIRDKDGNTLMKFDKVGNISISYGYIIDLTALFTGELMHEDSSLQTSCSSNP